MNQVNEKRSFVPIIVYIVLQYGTVSVTLDTVFSLLGLYNPLGALAGFMGSLALLNLVSFALWIYSLYWQSSITKDLNFMANTHEGGTANSRSFAGYFFLSLITLGIYGWYWLYKQGQRLKETSDAYHGHVTMEGSTYLLWAIIGSVLLCGNMISWILLNKNTNECAKAFNHRGVRNNTAEAPQPRFNPDDGTPLSNAPSTRYQKPRFNQDQGEKYPEETKKPVTSEVVDDDDDETVFYAHKVLFNEGQYKGGSIELENNGTIVLGRDGDVSNVIFDDSTISKKHCSITWNQSEGCFIVCDYSSNGTFYENGERFPTNEPVKCKVNTVIRLADGKNVLTLL